MQSLFHPVIIYEVNFTASLCGAPPVLKLVAHVHATVPITGDQIVTVARVGDLNPGEVLFKFEMHRLLSFARQGVRCKGGSLERE